MLVIAGFGVFSRALAQPSVPGFVVSTYAEPVPNPEGLTFDAAGNLYVGNDDPEIEITRVGPGGTPIVTYGNETIPDPDAVLFDATGDIAGTPGAILVGGSVELPVTQGQIKAVLPDQSVVTVFSPTAIFKNPSKMAFDSTGRLLFTDPVRGLGTGQIFASTGMFPESLVAVPGDPINIAVNGSDQIFTTTNAGTLAVYNADGTVANSNFASGLGFGPPLVFGPGGTFGQDLYVATSAGDLLRFDPLGGQTTVGTGFVTVEDLVFGADGALYLSENDEERVLRIEPPCGTMPDADEACHLAGPGGLGKSSLSIKNATDVAKDQFSWKWNKGSATTTDKFLAPNTSTATYHLCVYDNSAATQPIFEADIPPGGTCDGKDCWKVIGPATSPKGYRYKNKSATPDGITNAKFKAGTNGKAQVQVKAKGEDVQPPAPNALVTNVTVQLIIADGAQRECFKTTFSETGVKNKTDTQFKATGP